MVISYSSRGFDVFLKVLVIIIISVGENIVLEKIYIDKYQIRRWARASLVYIIFLIYYS